MRKSLLLLILLPASLCAQNLTTVTAANIQKAGVPLATGTLCFTATDSNDTALAFRMGGGGQAVIAPYCTAVTNGAIANFSVANPANTAPANISYRVEVFDAYSRVLKYTGVQFTGASFNFDSYVPQANLPLGTSVSNLSVGNLAVSGTCSGCAAGSGYNLIEQAGSNLAQRLTLNFVSGVTCSDNGAQSRTDCTVTGGADTAANYTWTGTHTFNAAMNIAGGLKINGAAAAGKIPIGDGTNFVPGDPLVQGLAAEGSTSAQNPVNVGGFDSAGSPAIHGARVLSANPGGSEYGFVVRNIPSGTQAVSVASLPLPSGAAQEHTNAGSPGSIRLSDGTSFYKGTTPSDTQPVSAASLPLPSNAAQETGGNLATLAAAVEPASTTPAAGDRALAVAFSPNSIGCAGQSLANTHWTPINFSSTSAQKIVSKVTGKNIYICHIELIVAAATNVALIAGTKSTNECDTSTAGLAGGTSAASGWNLAANSGLAPGNGQGAIAATAGTGLDVCLVASAANQVSGVLVWSQF